MIIKKEREDLEVFSFIFGACFGSFLSVLILKLPKKESIFSLNRSCCPSCGHTIFWYHNIPLISYLFLKAKCAYCKEKISPLYFFVELITALVTLFLFIKLGISKEFIYMCLLSYVLIVLSFIDINYKAVPDYLLLIVLIFSFFTTNYDIYEAFKNAFLFSGALVLLNFVVTFYIQNIKAKIYNDENLKTQEALGVGDIPIIAMIGVMLGVESGIIAIFLAAFFAIIPAIYSNLFKKDIEIPFIPYLVLGFFTEYFFELELYTKVFFEIK